MKPTTHPPHTIRSLRAALGLTGSGYTLMLGPCPNTTWAAIRDQWPDLRILDNRNLSRGRAILLKPDLPPLEPTLPLDIDYGPTPNNDWRWFAMPTKAADPNRFTNITAH